VEGKKESGSRMENMGEGVKMCNLQEKKLYFNAPSGEKMNMVVLIKYT